MTATDSFFRWFFVGLNGLGGWFIFVLIALAAVIWMLYDSASRRLPTLGWRLAVILTAALLIPAALYRFTSTETRDSLAGFLEAMFYLGLLGGLIPPVIAIGYYVTFQGMIACPDGHVYEAELGECPHPSHHGVAGADRAYAPPPPMAYPPAPQSRPASPAPPPPPSKPKAHAWLIAQDGRSYQLNIGSTSIGKSTRNDIALTGDGTVSREHAKIAEQDGRFRLHDLASRNGTKVNNQVVRQPVLLEPDDTIEFGDNTRLTFVTTRR